MVSQPLRDPHRRPAEGTITRRAIRKLDRGGVAIEARGDSFNDRPRRTEVRDGARADGGGPADYLDVLHAERGHHRAHCPWNGIRQSEQYGAPRREGERRDGQPVGELIARNRVDRADFPSESRDFLGHSGRRVKAVGARKPNRAQSAQLERIERSVGDRSRATHDEYRGNTQPMELVESPGRRDTL